MPKTIQTTIQCVNCRQPIRATIQSVIDPAQNPQAKIALLGGNINMVQCPNCGSFRTAELARFGSTACKAQYRCNDCLEPFDYFKPH